MSKHLSFYFPLKVTELETLVTEYQKEFDEMIKDSFSEEEFEHIEKKLDALAAVYVTPVMSELTFDDFEADEFLREFFDQCHSVLLLDHLPYLETNPFQVSWMQMFLSRFSNFLVDTGAMAELLTKEKYLSTLSAYKNMDGLIRVEKPAVPAPKHGISAPVLPIDFLILDVFKELERLKAEGKLMAALEKVAETDRPRKLFAIMKDGRLDADSLLRLSGFNPKEFDDNLEKLKFLLKKV